MTVRIEVSEEIERPVPVVFKFFAVDHVRNHPRWDPYIELSLDSDAPIGVGTVIRRRNSRSGTPVEGTMKVVEWEPNRSLGMITRDGPMEIDGRATFEEIGESRTRLTLDVDMPIDESMKDQIEGSIRQSTVRIKELIEAET
ncbi:MAG TPA: SRPBCC family protein [Actinomycetota bacterium]|nr:SRPBCC family protein [Actinomycetota bacterium]